MPPGAERIVTSALKLIPSHPVALALFTRLKERRQQAPTAEAWAEQELERLTSARARRSLDAARVEMAAGRERAAMLAIRRGLRHAPDDPELLNMLHDVEKVMERGKAGQHAVQAQVRAGLDLLGAGRAGREPQGPARGPARGPRQRAGPGGRAAGQEDLAPPPGGGGSRPARGGDRGPGSDPACASARRRRAGPIRGAACAGPRSLPGRSARSRPGARRPAAISGGLVG
jgi:hypothetical protein